METAITVRAAAPEDIRVFLELQDGSPEASQWTEEDYAAKLGHASTLALVAVPEGGGVAGFLFGQVAAGEMEILNFAVAPEMRRKGLGRSLLQEGLDRAFEQGARRCWLEVRASNHSALLFYTGQGFAELYRRPKYYSNPPEDALVLSFAIPPPGV